MDTSIIEQYWEKRLSCVVFQTNIACRKTRLERLSLAENCFASPRKYHGKENRFFVSYGGTCDKYSTSFKTRSLRLTELRACYCSFSANRCLLNILSKNVEMLGDKIFNAKVCS